MSSRKPDRAEVQEISVKMQLFFAGASALLEHRDAIEYVVEESSKEVMEAETLDPIDRALGKDADFNQHKARTSDKRIKAVLSFLDMFLETEEDKSKFVEARAKWETNGDV